MELQIVNIEGKSTGKKASLSDDVFSIEPNDHAIYLDTKLYLANQRQGTHKSKEKSEITGSTRKLKKQKGTGTARAGSIKSPIFRGGGRVFGPKPRNYSFKINKKVKTLARKSALSYKAKEESIQVIDGISLDAPKTKDFLSILKNLDLVGTKSLFVIPESNSNIVLSGRNIQKVNIKVASQISTYDILNADKLVLLEESISKVEETLK